MTAQILDGKAAAATATTEDWEIPGIASEGGSDEFGFSDDDISAFMVSGQKAAPTAPAGQGRSLRFDDELSVRTFIDVFACICSRCNTNMTCCTRC